MPALKWRTWGPVTVAFRLMPRGMPRRAARAPGHGLRRDWPAARPRAPRAPPGRAGWRAGGGSGAPAGLRVRRGAGGAGAALVVLLLLLLLFRVCSCVFVSVPVSSFGICQGIHCYCILSCVPIGCSFILTFAKHA